MSNRRILIVEDDADARLGYHVLLKANRYDTFFAADSISAISEVHKHRPDLILLDLGLPGGGGFIVLDALRADPFFSAIPVAVVSARSCSAKANHLYLSPAEIGPRKPEAIYHEQQETSHRRRRRGCAARL